MRKHHCLCRILPLLCKALIISASSTKFLYVRLARIAGLGMRKYIGTKRKNNIHSDTKSALGGETRTAEASGSRLVVHYGGVEC